MSIVDHLEVDGQQYRLGKLCKWGHEYRDTKKSIRFVKAGDCVECSKTYKTIIRQRVAEDRESKQTIVVESFDFSSGIYTLGELCPSKHDYQLTGQSVRLLSNNHCYHCRQDYYDKTAEHQRAKSRQYRRDNPERVRETFLNWYNKPEVRERQLQRCRIYYRENKAKLSIYNREYHKIHRARITRRNRERRQLMEVRLYYRSRNRRRERKIKELRIEPYTGKQLLERYNLFQHSCAYCGATTDLTDDHVVPIAADGYDRLLNLVPACRSCNSSKNAHPLIPWYKKQPFYSEERLLWILSLLGDREQRWLLDAFVIAD